MRRSNGRVLTTHVGSLPRPRDVADGLLSEDRGDDPPTELGDAIRRAVADAVARQVEVGLDIVNDGEMSKVNYATYVRRRLTGFDRFSTEPRGHPADLRAFPEFLEQQVAAGRRPAVRRPVCTGPVAHADLGPLRCDLERLREAVGDHDVDVFVNAASPGVVAAFHPNEYYASGEAYVAAIAEAMRPEYEAIVDAGFLLQVDCPDLAMARHMNYAELSDREFVRIVEIHVEALNHALQEVPAEATRLHVCWGNYEGPHVQDVPLTRIVRALLRAKPQALVVEAANPRHAHEWAVWKDVELPDDKILIPGVIDTTTNFVEHPELVAERILRFAGVVGRERIVATADCGFGTFAGLGTVHPTICWAKLEALTRGAAIASGALW